MFKKCLLLILALSPLGGCFAPSKHNIPKEAYPCNAGNLLIEEAPEKIAVLSPELENILTAFGLENTIAAVSDESSRECEFKIGTELYPNTEKIIESGAEYLFSLVGFEESVIKSLSDGGVRVFVISEPRSSADLKGIYDSIAKMFYGAIEAPKKSESAFAPYKKALEELKSKTGDSSFLYLSDRDLSQPIDTFSFGILSEIFKSGSENAAISEDELAAINPTYIFISGSLDEAYLLSLPAAENLSAVENGKIISTEYDFFSGFMPEQITALSLLIE